MLRTMRPKKPRYHCGCKDLASCTHDGILLEDNLYTDMRKRAGYYRYRNANGDFRAFQAASVDLANAAARQANELRARGIVDVDEQGTPAPKRGQLLFHVPRYIEHMEKLNPSLSGNEQWRNVGYAFKQFALRFDDLSAIEFDAIDAWWNELTYYQQHMRLAAFRRWFNWLMVKGLAPKLLNNPFALSYDNARLTMKVKPKKQRPKLKVSVYRKIHDKAGELGWEWLQLAMGISLYTSLREEDVATLRRKENLVDGRLRVVIGKSEAQLGEIYAARREWILKDHPLLERMIKRCLELCLMNRNCPFLISREPERWFRYKGFNPLYNHVCQVKPDVISRKFAEARDRAFPDVEFDRATNPGVCFHEVRGLSSTLYRKAGYSEEQVQFLMTHEDASTTRGYQDLDELPFDAVELKLTAEELFF